MTMNPWTAQQVMEARNDDLRRQARRRRSGERPRSRGRPSARLRFAGLLIRTGRRLAGPAMPVEEVLQLAGATAPRR